MIVRVKQNAYHIIGNALEEDIVNGLNKCDKYHETQLQDTQRQLLQNYITNYFWIAIGEAGIDCE